jgi:hypothetical protein
MPSGRTNKASLASPLGSFQLSRNPPLESFEEAKSMEVNQTVNGFAPRAIQNQL